jgi:hypothetical protein
MTVNAECGVEVDYNSTRLMIKKKKIGRVFQKLRLKGNKNTNADGIFILYSILYLTFVPYRKHRFTAGFSETSIHMYQTTQRHMPEDIFAVSSVTKHIFTYRGINSTTYLVAVWYGRIMKERSYVFVRTSSHGV